MMPVIVPATPEHAIAMAPRLRLNDAHEVRRMARRSPETVLLQSLELSTMAWTWIHNGRPGCMFGVVAEPIDNVGQPWMLGTDDVRDHPKLFWKHSRQIVRMMSAEFPKLTGGCDARYEATVRWLTRLGFALEGPFVMPKLGFTYYRFTMGQ